MGSSLNAFMENVFFRISWSSSILYFIIYSKKDHIRSKPGTNNVQASPWQRALTIAYVIVLIPLFLSLSDKFQFIKYIMLAGSVMVNISIVYNAFKIPIERDLFSNEFYAIQISFYASFYLTGLAMSLINVSGPSSEPHQIAYIVLKLLQYYFPILFLIMNITIALQRLISRIPKNSKDYAFEPYILPEEHMFSLVSRIRIRVLRLIAIPFAFILDFVFNIPIFIRSLINYFIIKPIYLFYKTTFCPWANKHEKVTDTSIIRSSAKISFILVLMLVYAVVEQNPYFSNAIRDIYGFVSSAIILPIVITDVLTYRESLKHPGE